MNIRKLVYIAFISAFSFLLMQFSLPFFSAPYLKVELSEMPVLLLGMLLSPDAALLAQAVKDLLMMALSGTVIWGAISDFLCGGIMAYSFCLAWHKLRMPPAKRLVACVAIGITLRCLISIPLNYVILGIEFGRSVQDITPLFLPVILPFNAVKGICNILVAGAVMRMIPRRLQDAIATAGELRR